TLKASSFNVKDSKLHMSFTLTPKKTGRSIFAPGFLSFSPEGPNILLPASSVECVSTGISSLMIAQCLPLYPESRISLSPGNRMSFLNPELLERVQQNNRAAYQEYLAAWDMLAGVLIIVALSMLFIWALVQYELVRRAKVWLKPKEDPLKMLL